METRNSISKLVISILGIVGEMGRKQILENQRQGIELRKSRGMYYGRMKGTTEDNLTFLSKPVNKKVLQLLKKGYKGKEISKIVGVSQTTVTKVKKVGLNS